VKKSSLGRRGGALAFIRTYFHGNGHVVATSPRTMKVGTFMATVMSLQRHPGR
jgi:hypothetical protein